MTWTAAASRLDPGNGEARDWLHDELAKAPYRDTRDPVKRLLDAITNWISDLIDGAQAPVSPLPTFVAGLAVVALVALAVFATRYVRRSERRKDGPAVAVLGDERLTAQQYRTRARKALQDGRYAACVLDAVRAIAAGSVERTLLEDTPSLTAHEIASRLSLVFPDHRAALATAADDFDAVAYGGETADRSSAEALLELDSRLAAARPVRTGSPDHTFVGATS